MIDVNCTDVQGVNAEQAIEWMSGHQGVIVRESVVAMMAVSQGSLSFLVNQDPQEVLAHNELSQAMREKVAEIAEYQSFLKIWDQIRNQKVPLRKATASISHHVR